MTAAGRRRRCALVVVGASIVWLSAVAWCAYAPAASAGEMRIRVAAPAREQEPLARVPVRARVTDGSGRGRSGVRCGFVWRQGGVVLRRATAVTNGAGRVLDRAAVRHAVAGAPVRVVVTCRRSGRKRAASTWFVPQAPLPVTPKIVFVGDSLTVGLYASTQATCFRSLLGAAVPCTVAVTASSGGRSGEVDLADVTAAAGDIYVVELGTNDAAGFPDGRPVDPAVFAANLGAVVRAARTGAPSCRFVFLTVWQPPRMRRPYDARIETVARASGDHVVRLGDLKDDFSCSRPAGVATVWGASDGWHPNDSGHAAIASRLTALVRRLLRLSGVPVD
jgi:acyl-CoA thioesterase-1